VLTLVNMSIMNTSIASSSRLNVVALNEDDSKKVGEELRRADLRIVPLSLYSFVCQIQDPVKKTSD
jgi:hypothetical protein